MKNKLIVPILNNEYKVIVCWGDSREIGKVLKKHGHSPEDTHSSLLNNRGVCFYSKDCHPVIALPHKPRTAEQIGTLSHEAVHAIEDIFLKVSQPIGGEIFAHSVGAVVRAVLGERSKNA